MRTSFVFYAEWRDALQGLPADVRLECYEGIIEYAISGNIPALKCTAMAVFKLVQGQIDRNNQKFENGCKGADYGKLGGRPKTPKKPLKNPKETPKKPLYENENENENEKKIIPPLPPDGGSVPDGLKIETVETIPPHGTKARGAARFVPPTVAEVAAYCAERGNNVNPEQWHSYYTSNGWKVGKNPMKDWRGAVRTWEKNGYGNSNRQQNGKPTLHKRKLGSDFD